MALKMFTYGTLISDYMRESVLGREVPAEPDMAKGFVVGMHTYAPYASIKPFQGGTAPGVVFEVTEEDIKKLDRYENGLYDKIKVETLKNGECIAYIEKTQ